ncbi:MAG: phloretin hydrolase [Desulfomonilia bacterium]|jgi:hypothetical protein
MGRLGLVIGKDCFASLLTMVFLCLGPVHCLACLSGLTSKERAMPEARYHDTSFAPIPEEVEAGLSPGPISPEKALRFEAINDLLEPGYLDVENGYCLNPDRTGFVAVRTDFPGATGEMIHWWFWWHALEDIRYKIWCPGEHFAIGVRDEQRMNDASLSYQERYLNNPQYPVEDVGFGIRWLSIRFVPPEDFGFDTSRFDEAGIEAAICGIVGDRIFGFTVEHTYMVHLFRRTDTGLELRSRFWIGKVLPSYCLRKLMIYEYMAKAMGYHCATEYNHLAEFLPDIFEEFK